MYAFACLGLGLLEKSLKINVVNDVIKKGFSLIISVSAYIRVKVNVCQLINLRIVASAPAVASSYRLSAVHNQADHFSCNIQSMHLSSPVVEPDHLEQMIPEAGLMVVSAAATVGELIDQSGVLVGH